MSERKPPDWFDHQVPPEDDRDGQKRKRRLLDELPKLMERQRDRGRADSCYPYLLVRSVIGDRGDRAINTCFWESPDIWTAPGEPTAAPAVPPNHGGQVNAGEPCTLYAHVWNLGFAPLAGIFVEFYWLDPSLGISGANANLIGVARCELSARGMQGSHKLVKCPKAWVPTFENGGHECLVVRVSGIGDPLGANDWQPWLNRHVAQRNIGVVTAGANISSLVASLGRTRPFNTRIQLIQLGAREGELARHIASPKLRVAEVDTHVLAEMNVMDEIVAVDDRVMPAGAMAAVHPRAAGGPAEVPPRLDEAAVRMLDPAVTISHEKVARARPGKHLADLFSEGPALHRSAQKRRGLVRNEMHVLRVAAYNGEQLVGGYTLVIEGR